MAKPGTISVPITVTIGNNDFTPPTAITAEGARVGISVCNMCGAAILMDPRDNVNRQQQHLLWHHRPEMASRVKGLDHG